MHKPFQILINDESIWPMQEYNLISAICLSSIFSLKDEQNVVEITEKEFFKKIIQIPYISSNNFLLMIDSYFKLLDPINSDVMVDDLIQDFKEIYLPIIQKMTEMEDWDNYITYKDGNFFIVSRLLLNLEKYC